MKKFFGMITVLLMLGLSIPAFAGLSTDAENKWPGLSWQKNRIIEMMEEGFDTIDIAYGTEPATPDTGKGTFWASDDVVYLLLPGGSSLSLLDMMRTTYDTDDNDIVDKAEDLGLVSQATGDSTYYDGSNWVVNDSGALVNVYFGTINAGTSDERPVFIAPYDCELIVVQLVNASDIATDAVSYTTVTLRDKGSDGSADNEIASVSNAAEGTAFDDFDAVSVGTLDATHKLLTSGDVVSLKKTDTAGGTATDEMMVMITYKRR